ncbi:GH1 family beta-glucosidase [Gramella sp. GC03-9]|uniref:Beta-glucosidase n=1 Tax=Christiangramia oceanisediminis TaxID=2920386 RepID=A0A9X2RBV7_9FLAO|nr:GH1 family beta-glucosidase [Gramella oceanisediminis]MCP9201279.1 GH1 family beta-glucosidase [Gramella oceanisediminis]
MYLKYSSYKSANSFVKDDFGKDFHWGVSTAAFQTEGSPIADGKGLSIWDVFSTKKGRIYQNQNAEVACDFYHRYEEDIKLMAEMNIPNFRFSVSWSRIIPAGTGTINQAGIDFYNKVIDCCLVNGVEPWITLYHWDLPNILEEKGGWTNRKILEWFSEYVTVCAQKFGDRVKHWMVLNEPLVFTGAGYFLGLHAPGKKGIKNFLPAVHHAALCQSIGGRILKRIIRDSRIGTTFSSTLIEPYRKNKKDENAAIRVDALVNRLFIEPSLGMGYPTMELPFLKKIDKYKHKGDEELLKFDFDFIGIQNYTREIIKKSWFVPFIKATNVKAEKRKVPTTQMGWEVYPPSIYEILRKFGNYDQSKELIVTENGAAFPDHLTDGNVNDTNRKKFIKKHLQEVLRAKKEGVNVRGYFVWSFTDNFEWAEGYKPRFGLVYIDYKTQKRSIKSSGIWYSEFLKNASSLRVLK